MRRSRAWRALLFDEFHERSSMPTWGQARPRCTDGIARGSARIPVMSATIDGARVAKLSRRTGHR
jgi:ATP-dependent helicase HrpB